MSEDKINAITHNLFERISLRRDIPEKGLRRGDVGTIVDWQPGEKGGEDGYSLEFFNAVGETVAVVVVPESAIEPLHRNEVLHIRRLSSLG